MAIVHKGNKIAKYFIQYIRHRSGYLQKAFITCHKPSHGNCDRLFNEIRFNINTSSHKKVYKGEIFIIQYIMVMIMAIILDSEGLISYCLDMALVVQSKAI